MYSHVQVCAMYVYMNMYMHKGMRTCLHAYAYIHTYIHTYIRTYIHTYIHTYICIVYSLIHRSNLHLDKVPTLRRNPVGSWRNGCCKLPCRKRPSASKDWHVLRFQARPPAPGLINNGLIYLFISMYIYNVYIYTHICMYVYIHIYIYIYI